MDVSAVVLIRTPCYQMGGLITDGNRLLQVTVTDEPNRPGDDVVCANCGSDLDMQTWTPTVVEDVDDELPEIHRFCDEECREGWRDGR